jgi:hypothetical protein
VGDVVGLGAGPPVVLPGKLVQALGSDAKLSCQVCIVPARAKRQKSLELLKSLLGLIRLFLPGLQHKNADPDSNLNSNETTVKLKAQAVKP